MIHGSWKSQGFAVQKAIEDKKVRYTDAYDFAPIGGIRLGASDWEIGGRPSLVFVKFMKLMASHTVVTLN